MAGGVCGHDGGRTVLEGLIGRNGGSMVKVQHDFGCDVWRRGAGRWRSVVAWVHGEVASRLGGVGGEDEVIGGQGAAA